MCVSALKGGGAAKEADGFEERWTVNMLFDLLEESASQIELEPPGTTKGFEFSLQRDGHREWHQVKYQNSKLGKWTLNGLEDEKVLTYFKSKLDSEPDAHCLFFSCDSAFPLRLLWERSQMSETVERFLEHFLEGHKGDFDDLRDKWGQIDAETAWSLLLRITTQNMDDANLRKSNRDRARSLVDADDPSDVVRLLYELINERVHQRLDTEQVWEVLGEKGWGPRAWRTDAGVLERVRDTTSKFLGRQEELLINKDFIAVDEVKQVIERLQAPVPTAPVVVHGPPGCGKSTAMTKVIRHFADQGWRVLTLDLGWIGGVTSSEELGAKLGLPGAPADVLGGIVKDQRALLVVDGLDRIAASLGSPQQLTAVLSDVLSTAGSHKRLAVLLSCRTTDLENDVRVQSAVSRFGDSEHRVELGRWSAASVKSVLLRSEIDPDQLRGEQIELLRIPQNLFLLVESRDASGFDFETELDLQARYTTFKEVGL
jgi:hypothetical protein